MGSLVSGKLEDFFEGFREISYGKGETILRAEDEPAGIYFVKSGYVRGYAISEKGSELTVNIFKPGSYFPMTWALAEMPNGGYYEAMTEVVVWRAPKEKVVEFLKGEPEVAWELMRRVLIGLGSLAGRMVNLLFANALARVAMVVWIAGRRFGKAGKNGEVEVRLHLTHQEIGNQAGLTRETTSVEMEKLEDKGLIAYKGRVLMILDMGKLAEEARAEGEEAESDVF